MAFLFGSSSGSCALLLSKLSTEIDSDCGFSVYPTPFHGKLRSYNISKPPSRPYYRTVSNVDSWLSKFHRQRLWDCLCFTLVVFSIMFFIGVISFIVVCKLKDCSVGNSTVNSTDWTVEPKPIRSCRINSNLPKKHTICMLACGSRCLGTITITNSTIPSSWCWQLNIPLFC